MLNHSLISRVTPILADKYLFVEVETRDGRIGTGEAGAWAHIEATRAVLEKFGEYLKGRDAELIERHWQTLRRFGSYCGSIVMAAVSAIDTALWDLKGQHLAEPIYGLLGGPYRDKIRLYGQAHGKSRAELIESCLQLKKAGFTAIGHVNPFLDEDISTPLTGTQAAYLRNAVETLEEVRAAVGVDIDLCVEIHRRLRPAEAIDFGRRIAHLNPMFYEDPIRPDSSMAMARVQDHVGIPVATGERFFSLEQFHELLRQGGARYIRPCLSLCGGITGARKIATLAEAFDTDVIPHNTYSPVATLASVHLAAGVPNILVLEYPTASYTDHHASTVLMGRDLVTYTPKQEQGYLTVAPLAGLGTGLTNDIARRHPFRSIPIEMRSRADGSPMEH